VSALAKYLLPFVGMSSDARRLLWLCAALAAGASCSLNPQPALPDSDDDDGVLTPTAGKGSSSGGGGPDIGLGGSLNTGEPMGQGGDSAEAAGGSPAPDGKDGGAGGASDGGVGGSADGGVGGEP